MRIIVRIHTCAGVVEVIFVEDEAEVGNGTGVKLATEDDVTHRGTKTFVVTLDEDVTPQLEARREGHHDLREVCGHRAANEKKLALWKVTLCKR